MSHPLSSARYDHHLARLAEDRWCDAGEYVDSEDEDNDERERAEQHARLALVGHAFLCPRCNGDGLAGNGWNCGPCSGTGSLTPEQLRHLHEDAAE